ncbi:hypothetical protein [Actinopolymorpha pittospori]|uniref:Uncharacterized protein n=1 Tax=Actinopolymorpha pittospori TaxID=648752 RepID=A0A927N0K0_9ACTN|nr:hypothetical protein [Actinopolymorpha pittospori]MBE1608708.1 hypothetical protein [Actinopolymorpha pittospori]
MDPIINDGQARRLAAEWHGGQWTALYSLASSGHIDRDRLRTEISREVQALEHGCPRRDLLALDKYVRHRGDTSTVPGWHRLWDETPVRLDQT